MWTSVRCKDCSRPLAANVEGGIYLVPPLVVCPVCFRARWARRAAEARLYDEAERQELRVVDRGGIARFEA